MAKTRSIIPTESVDRSIVLVRGQKVMLAPDLARLYGVTAKALNQAVKRNLDRFPDDFMFQLTWEEAQCLRSQNVTLNKSAGSSSSSAGGKSMRGKHVKYLPYAFTEQGVAMLSSVLKSQRAVRVNVEIMRAFVRLRQVLATNAELGRRLDDLEAKVGRHDEQFVAVIQAIRGLMEPPPDPPRKRIGFITEAEGRLGHVKAKGWK